MAVDQRSEHDCSYCGGRFSNYQAWFNHNCVTPLDLEDRIVKLEVEVANLGQELTRLIEAITKLFRAV